MSTVPHESADFQNLLFDESIILDFIEQHSTPSGAIQCPDCASYWTYRVPSKRYMKCWYCGHTWFDPARCVGQ